jgi:branched-chain amino acid transport system permease protein
MTTSLITTSRSRRLWRFLPGLAGGALIAYAVSSGDYLVSVLTFALIYTIFTTGLNLFMGYAGQVSFGQNAFAALCGYASAILTTTYEWEPVAGLLVGIALAAIVALIVGYPTLRLKGHYLAMATLAIGLIAYEVAVQWESLTEGYTGISGIPSPGIGPFHADSDMQKLVVTAAFAAVGLYACHRIRHSRLGRALVAVGGNEEAARALGVDVARYKLAAFVISAVYAAVAGWLFVHVVGFVCPEVFGLHMVNVGFTMLYAGGLGSAFGPLVGAVVISLLPEVFRPLKDYQDLAYGVVLILILIYAPRGMASLPQLWQDRIGRRP